MIRTLPVPGMSCPTAAVFLKDREACAAAHAMARERRRVGGLLARRDLENGKACRREPADGESTRGTGPVPGASSRHLGAPL